MHDPPVYPVGPVVVEDFDVVLVFERGAPSLHGSCPTQAMVQNEVADTTICLCQIPSESSVPSQFGGDPLEEVQSIRPGQLADLLPGLVVIVGVESCDDAQILLTEILEILWTLCRPFFHRHVVVPEGHDVVATHLAFLLEMERGMTKGE